MTIFNISGIGRIDIKRGTLSCNINVSPPTFIRKYRNYLIKFPQSIIDVIKTSILSKNTPIQYKELYYHTLLEFFTKIRENEDQDQILEKRVHETSIHESISNLSKDRKLGTFMEKRNKNLNYPVEITSINKNISKKSIQVQLAKINRLIEDRNFLEAKSLISLTLPQLRYLENMGDIEKRLMTCQTYIGLVDDLHQIKNLIRLEEFSLASTQLKEKEKKIQKLDLSMELYSHIHQEYSQASKKLESDRKKAISDISDAIIQITNLLRIAEYNTCYHLIQKITKKAVNWKFTQITDKILELQQELKDEQSVLSELLTFAKLHITRIHISELSPKTSLAEQKIEKIVKNLIKNGILQAQYDPLTQGIEFQYFQKEIDDLMQNFHEWESDSNYKKS